MNSASTRIILLTILVAVMIIAVLASCGDASAPASPTVAARDTPTTLVAQPTTQPTQDATDGWRTFTSEADGFSVDMPGEPEVSTRTADSPLGRVTFHFFQLSDGSAQYVVSYNDYGVPLELLNADEVLSDAIQGAAQGGEMENVQTVEVQGNPGTEGETSIQGQRIWYRAILVKDRMYQLVASSPESDKDASAFGARRFIDSFTLLD